MAEVMPVQREYLATWRTLQPGQCQQVIDDRGKTISLPGNDIKKTGEIIRIVLGALDQRLGKSLDGCNRGLEFMRYVGDKLPAQVFQPFQLGCHPVQGFR